MPLPQLPISAAPRDVLDQAVTVMARVRVIVMVMVMVIVMVMVTVALTAVGQENQMQTDS